MKFVQRSLRIAALLLATCIVVVSCGGDSQSAATLANSATQSSQRQRSAIGATTVAPSAIRTNIGFRTRSQFNEHFAKHGAEFNGISKSEYLLLAQTLRDEPAGGSVLELRRADGTVSRYDRKSGAFIAYDADGTIRTFFKPNNGESYFRRQALKIH